MSFDLYFWKYERAGRTDHVAVADALAAGEPVEGLASLDTGAMVETLAELLSDWERVEPSRWERRTKAGGYLSSEAYERHLILSMSFNVSRAVLLKISTPMRRFGAGLWNPQMNSRIAGYGEGQGADA